MLKTIFPIFLSVFVLDLTVFQLSVNEDVFCQCFYRLIIRSPWVFSISFFKIDSPSLPFNSFHLRNFYTKFYPKSLSLVPAISAQSLNQSVECEAFEYESMMSSGINGAFEICASSEDSSCEFESINLEALSALATSMENRIHHEPEFGCFEKFLQLVNLHVEGTPLQLMITRAIC